MPQVLDYHNPASRVRPRRRRIGYVLLMVANSIGLLAAFVVFLGGISGDSYAPMWCTIIGGPFLLADGLLAGLPAWIYLASDNVRLDRRPRVILFLMSVAPLVVAGGGMVLSWVLPTTHGGS
jgi:hypothetical protein